MLIISGNGNGGKRDNNAGSAEKGDGNTERTTTIPKDEVSTSNVTESDGMTDSDRWGAAVQTKHKRLVMSNTSGGSQDKYNVICDSGANMSFFNDISLFNNRTRIVTFSNCTPDPQENTSAAGGDNTHVTPGRNTGLQKCLIDRGGQMLQSSVAKVYVSYI